MKRSLSVILVGVMIASDLYINPVVAEASVAKDAYGWTYGSQLEGHYENDYSRMIYEELVNKYVGTVEGTYKTFARPMENDDIEMAIDVSDWTFRVEAADTDSIKAEMNRGASEIQKKLGKAVNDAYTAFEKDYPEVFWIRNVSCSISISNKMMATSTGVEAEISITKFVIQPEEAFEGAIDYMKEFNAAAAKAKTDISLMYGIHDNSKKADISKAIHDYLASRLKYNTNAAVNGMTGKYACAYTPVPVFINMNEGAGVVCEGYAKAFKILANQFALENVILMGKAMNTNGGYEAHMWNAVKLEDGKWYAIDNTWDDQEQTTYYNYFLAGQNTKGFRYPYCKDHIASTKFSDYAQAKEFILPQIAENGYYSQGSQMIELPTYVYADSQNIAGNYNAGNPTGSLKTNTIVQSTNGGEWKILNLKRKVSYTGKAIKQNIVIERDGVVLKEGVDYLVSYRNNVNAGKASIRIIPMGNYIYTKNKEFYFTISKISITKTSSKKIKAKKYNKRKAIKPAVTLKYKGVKLIKGRDYTIKYKNNKKRGTAKIIVTGKGNYTGKRIIKFKIK